MPDDLIYAKVGVTPDAHHLRVIDLDTGAPVNRVLEINTRQGWLVRHVTDGQGRPVRTGDGLATERVAGRFRLEKMNA